MVMLEVMPLRHIPLFLLLALYAPFADALPGDGGTDGGSDKGDVAHEVVYREREGHLRQAQALEARARLEREMAVKQTDPRVRREILKEADRLSALAAKERGLLTPEN